MVGEVPDVQWGQSERGILYVALQSEQILSTYLIKGGLWLRLRVLEKKKDFEVLNMVTLYSIGG